MRECPQSFINVGAYSVLMRHEIEAHDDHWKGTYQGLKTALRTAERDLKALGFANMELAEGERLMLDAAREATAGDWDRAYHTQRMGHNSWRKMLADHGVKAPTDDDILKAHAAMNGAILAKSGLVSPALKALSTLGNWR